MANKPVVHQGEGVVIYESLSTLGVPKGMGTRVIAIQPKKQGTMVTTPLVVQY